MAPKPTTRRVYKGDDGQWRNKKDGNSRSTSTPTPAPLDPALVREIVLQAHGDLARVQELITTYPALVNAAWDWGGGDWETPLGAAAHVGRKEIARYLLDHGARMDIFAAAMLGYRDVVAAILAAEPQMIDARGPHGIPLLVHAEAGGAEAAAVVELLKRAAK